MKPRLKQIQDQVVVLFGATSGIGLETAMNMVEKGARVVIVGRNQEGLNDAIERVRTHAVASMNIRNRRNGKKHGQYTAQRTPATQGAAGGTFSQSSFEGRSYGESAYSTSATTEGRYAAGTQTEGMHTSTTMTDVEDQVIALEADVTNFEEVRSVAEQVVQRFGRIDTWVNIAAVSEWALFEDTSPEEFRRIIEVNLVGNAYGAMAAMPYMKQQRGGSLIFVSSVNGRVPIPYQSAYNASKHGILGLVDTLRLEVKHTKIPINVVAILPASINTPLFNKARTKLGVEPNPIPPIYDAKMVAKAITYAAHHPVRELIVGDSGYAMTFMRRLAPTLTNNFMGASGFRTQRSKEPKSPQAPDNLYEHLSGYNRVDGEFTPRTKRFSPLTWLATHPKARMGITALLIGGTALLIGSRIRSARRHRSWGHRASHQVRDFGRNLGDFLTSLPLISSLPMFERKSFLQRVGDRLPKRHSKPLKDRIADTLEERKPEHLPLYEQRKALAKKMPSASDVKAGVDEFVAKRKPYYVMRRETLITKTPEGERRETIYEKVPVEND